MRSASVLLCTAAVAATDIDQNAAFEPLKFAAHSFLSMFDILTKVSLTPQELFSVQDTVTGAPFPFNYDHQTSKLYYSFAISAYCTEHNLSAHIRLACPASCNASDCMATHCNALQRNATHCKLT